jgi:radical SAM superfamily enzyme YgiQ (UPF0313 family)
MPDRGFPIVLSADRSLMAAHPLLLDGMAASAQSTAWPANLIWPLIARPVASGGVRAHQAPLGVRRVESALTVGDVSAGEMIVAAPERIEQAIGPATRIVGLSSGDPLGMGMTSTTVTGIFGGRPVTSARFQKLLERVRRRLAAVAPEARVVLGGPGVWQARENDEAERALRDLGIDHVVSGYCEANIAELFRQLRDGASLPFVLEGQGVAASEIPPIRGASVMGLVEVSRGCGWGCDFCTLADQPMIHLDEETIVADVETNVAAGVANVSLTSEDFLRYGAAGRSVNPRAVIHLLERLNRVPQLATLAIDHANVVSVAAFSDEELAEVRRLLALGRDTWRPWVNMGVETACGELLRSASGTVKTHPHDPGDWGQLCREQVLRLCRADYLPMVSLVIGLPGEQAEHVEETIRWVESLVDEPVSIVPVLLTPVRTGARGRVAAGDLTRRQWDLFRLSMATTFRRLPSLYRQHHRAAGVGLAGRLFKQILGQGYAMRWRYALWRRHRAARS